MQKEKIIKVALLGLVNGLLISSSESILAKENEKTQSSKVLDSSASTDSNSENLGYHLMTEDELLLELNDEGTKLYMSLSPEGKALAREVASQRCQNTNSCKGLNACESEKNKCAGKGTCKGTTKCAVSDKNLAVKLAADKMAQKRSQAVQGIGK